jgi:hypothetical protein
MAFDQLKASGGAVEISPQRERDNRAKHVESESDSAGLVLPRDTHEKSPGDRKENQRCDYASHA